MNKIENLGDVYIITFNLFFSSIYKILSINSAEVFHFQVFKQGVTNYVSCLA